MAKAWIIVGTSEKTEIGNVILKYSDPGDGKDAKVVPDIDTSEGQNLPIPMAVYANKESLFLAGHPAKWAGEFESGNNKDEQDNEEEKKEAVCCSKTSFLNWAIIFKKLYLDLSSFKKKEKCTSEITEFNISVPCTDITSERIKDAAVAAGWPDHTIIENKNSENENCMWFKDEHIPGHCIFKLGNNHTSDKMPGEDTNGKDDTPPDFIESPGSLDAPIDFLPSRDQSIVTEYKLEGIDVGWLECRFDKECPFESFTSDSDEQNQSIVKKIKNDCLIINMRIPGTIKRTLLRLRRESRNPSNLEPEGVFTLRFEWINELQNNTEEMLLEFRGVEKKIERKGSIEMIRRWFAEVPLNPQKID